MTFGDALEVLKEGNAVARTGWNGKGQYAYMHKFNDLVEPCFILKNAQGKYQPGWVPSMGDMLATDWEVHIPL
jgi:hypothetical protein